MGLALFLPKMRRNEFILQLFSLRGWHVAAFCRHLKQQWEIAMKKTVLLAAATAVLALSACGKKDQNEAAEASTEAAGAAAEASNAAADAAAAASGAAMSTGDAAAAAADQAAAAGERAEKAGDKAEDAGDKAKDAAH